MKQFIKWINEEGMPFIVLGILGVCIMFQLYYILELKQELKLLQSIK